MFDHPDVAACWVSIEIENAPQRVLVVETELPLSPTTEEYDEGKVNALIAAAKAYKDDKGNGIDKIRLVYVDFDDLDDEEEEEEA